jgi:pilus assembly protein CpaB
MNTRTIIVTVLAIVCGVSAMFIVATLQSRSTSKGTEHAVRAMVVAKDSISRGTLITEAMVKMEEWSEEDTYGTPLFSLEDCIGRVAISNILGGQLVVEENLAGKGGGHGLAALIPTGMRAYTIQTSRESTNVAGFVLPDNRVDVLLTMNRGSQVATGGGGTLTLLQAAKILAVDQDIDVQKESDEEDSAPRTQARAQSVTLLITPDQVTLLDLGQNMGTLSLSLRSSSDTEEAPSSPATVVMLQNLMQGLPARPNPEEEIDLYSQLLLADEDAVSVVVARERIRRGTLITEDLVEVQRRPKAFASENNTRDIADCVGRSIYASLSPGDCVLENQLASADYGQGMEAMIPIGMRAYSIETSSVSASVAGFISPGNFVDVLLTINEEEGEKVTAPLLEVAEVLAIDQRLDRPTEDEADARQTQSVTLLVTQDQALILEMGLSLGTPSLVLRNPADKEQRMTNQLTLSMLMDLHARTSTQTNLDEEDGEEVSPDSNRQQTYMIRTLRGGFSGYIPVNVWNPEE